MSRRQNASPITGPKMNTTSAQRENQAFFWVHAMLLCIVVVGFGRSFFLRPLFAASPLKLLLLVHGAVLTLWFALTVQQAWSARTRRKSWHARAAWLALPVLIGVVISGLWVNTALALEITSAQDPENMFIWANYMSLLSFVVLVALAVVKRRQLTAHRRLMLCLCRDHRSGIRPLRVLARLRVGQTGPGARSRVRCWRHAVAGRNRHRLRHRDAAQATGGDLGRLGRHRVAAGCRDGGGLVRRWLRAAALIQRYACSSKYHQRGIYAITGVRNIRPRLAGPRLRAIKRQAARRVALTHRPVQEQFAPTVSMPKLPGRLAAIAMLLCLAPGATFAAATESTELLCSMRTGESVSTLRVSAGTDPLAPASIRVGDSYELRAVALSDAADAGRVAQVVVTVLDLEGTGRSAVLSQSRWSASGHEVLDGEAAWRPTLSGWERVYSPTLGRELAWGCALVQKGAAPKGWDRADATGDSMHQALHEPGQAKLGASDAAVQLAWMGDVMLADGPGRVISRGQDPFGAVTTALKNADVRIANLECVIAAGGRRAVKPWTFRAHPRVLEVLRRHVDAVSLANNHSGDFGPHAFAQMLDRLQQAGLPYFGGGTDLRAAHQPAIIERQGLRIALLGYNEMFPRGFEAGPNSPGIAWADEEQIVADIQAARAQADVVIPYMHWGQEHSETSHARQRALARLMIRAGADAVVGTHPHVRQDTELIDGKPVIYSLGNFVFDGFSDADNNTGSILWMTVTAAGVMGWHLQPVHIDASGKPHLERSADSLTPARRLAASLMRPLPPSP